MGDNLPAISLGSGFVPVSVAAGYSHTCVLSSQGHVKCWGQNSEGQLGMGDTNDRGRNESTFSDVDLGGYRATQITANVSHTCALLENHTIRCWGNNFFGQLGLGDSENRGDDPNEMGNNLLSADLGSSQLAVAVAAGGAFTCALLQSGAVKCWGRNEHGILGRTYCQDSDGNVGLCTNANYPLAIRGYGIGDGQMGDALATISLGSGRTAASLVALNSSICAVLDNGSLKCWGANEYGQLGLGDSTDRGLTSSEMGDTLSAVNLGSTLSLLSAGDTHACAIVSGSQVKCWGYNRYGNLGLEDTTNRGDASGQMGTNLPYVGF
jgi:alpha-tubulin suppressor-like RCC1 family protein